MRSIINELHWIQKTFEDPPSPSWKSNYCHREWRGVISSPMERLSSLSAAIGGKANRKELMLESNGMSSEG